MGRATPGLLGVLIVLAVWATTVAAASPPGRVTSSASLTETTLTLELAEPLPLVNGRPEFRRRGRVLGHPRVAGRTLHLTVSGVVTAEGVEAWLGARRLDGPTPELHDAAPIPPPAPAVPVGAPVAADPGLPGPYAVAAGRYRAPDLPVGFPVPVEVRGEVMYPTDAPGARPLVLILHGRHGTCYRGRVETGDARCPTGYRPLRNETGYRGMARVLASQGNVVVSIRANAISAQDDLSIGGGSEERAALVVHHLGLWARWTAAGGAPFAEMRGRVDLSRTILVGHSRGGEGVARAALTRSPQAPWTPRGLVLIAPTSFTAPPTLGIPTAVLLPTCDGDVTTLEGQAYVDRSRDLAPTDTALRSAVLIVGANHNAFNTEWMPGTAASAGSDDSSCARRPRRLPPAVQRAVGTTYTSALVRAALDADPDSLALLDGSLVHARSAGAATVRTAALGGARTRIVAAGDIAGVSGAGITTAACRDIGPADQRPPGCVANPGIHFLGAPLGDRRLAARGITVTWSAPGGTLELAPAAPIALGGATHVDVRVIVRAAPQPVLLDAAILDSSGAEVPLSPLSDLPRLPGAGAEPTANWAQTLRFAIPPGFPGATLTALRLRARSSAASIVILDTHLRTAGLPAAATPLPRVDLVVAPVREALPGRRRSATVRLAVRGPVATPARVRVGVAEIGGSPRLRTLTLPPGSSGVDVPIRVRGDRAFNAVPLGPVVEVVPLSGVTTGRNVIRVPVRDDDPAPRVIVSPRRALLREGDVLEVRLRLTRPVSGSTLLITAVPLRTRGRELQVGDVRPGVDFTVFTTRRDRSVSEAGLTAAMSFSPTEREAVVRLQTRRDSRREAPERMRLEITPSLGERSFLPRPIAIVITVRDR